MNKKTLTRILIGMIVLTVIVTPIAYFILADERPWMAFYFACCGGVLVVNFLASIYLVNKNIKK